MESAKVEDLKKKIADLRGIQKSQKPKRSKPMTPPRYDNVYFEGIGELFGDDQ